MQVCARRIPMMVVALVVGVGSLAHADVKTQERTQVKFEGMLGTMMGLFGGKAAKEGIVSSVAIKGDRKLESTGDTGEIVDLAEEKVYRLDFKKRTYTVVTFAELRRQLEEARKKAAEQARQAQQEKSDKPAEEPKVEVEFDLKETGQKKALAGYDCREVVMTVTVREKGKTLEQAGGMVLVANTWLGPEIAALKEQADFERRYAQKVYGELMSVESMQQMAAAMAMYPGMQQAMERMSKEQVNMSGTPLLTTMTFQMVKTEQQVAEEKKRASESEQPSGMGGLGGMFARKMMKKKETPEATGQPANRATIMTSTTEVLKIGTDVSPADTALPAGFKEKN